MARFGAGPRLAATNQETVMRRPIDLQNETTPWTTLEDAADEEFLLLVPEPCRVADWYQDAPEYTLPKECTPNWRTVH
jgi:hypothetical protein